MDRLTKLLFVLILSFFCVFLIPSCEDRQMSIQIIPEQFEALTVYDIDPFAGRQVDSIALAEVPHVTLRKSVVQEICRDVSYHRGDILWKGSWLAIARMQDGTQKRMAISYYGGFLKILNQHGYYRVEGQSRKLFESEMKAILVNTFIPARRKAIDDVEHRSGR